MEHEKETERSGQGGYVWALRSTRFAECPSVESQTKEGTRKHGYLGEGGPGETEDLGRGRVLGKSGGSCKSTPFGGVFGRDWKRNMERRPNSVSGRF